MTTPRATLQPRCIFCDREHHNMDLVGVSRGELPCRHCQRHSIAMTRDQLIAIRRVQICMRPYPYRCVSCDKKPHTVDELVAHLAARHRIPDPDPRY